MSDDLFQQKHSKIGLWLYGFIFVLIAIDLVSDFNEGTDWAHLTVELVVLVISIVGLTLLGREYYQQTQQAMQHLVVDLKAAQHEAKQWRDESHELIQGLGVEIQKQFVRWQLTPAESEIGLLLLKGFSHQEIANLRSVSERTVREQARALYSKAGLTGRTSLSAFFLEDLLLPA